MSRLPSDRPVPVSASAAARSSSLTAPLPTRIRPSCSVGYDPDARVISPLTVSSRRMSVPRWTVSSPLGRRRSIQSRTSRTDMVLSEPRTDTRWQHTRNSATMACRMEPRRIAGYAIVLILVGVLCVQYIRALEPAASEDRTGACRRLAPTLFNPKLGKLPASARTIDELKLGFSAQDYTGATVPLSAYRGRVVLVNFWQTNCAPCKVEMPSMESLLKQFRTDD